MATPGSRLIRSAGGVVYRTGGDGVRIAIVHRDRYDDWSLPKGKVDRDEHVLIAAVREVREETAVTAIPEVRLPTTRYLTGAPGVEKSVDFWSMRAVVEDPFESNPEVTELCWATPAEADALLTYAHDRGVLAAFTALRPVDGTVVFIRHAQAGRRDAWAGDDAERPLSATGQREAAALAPVLAAFRPARVFSAPVRRCVDTVAPIGLPVRADTVFAEETAAAPQAVARRLRGLAAEYGRIVVSSQGGVMPAVVAALRPRNASVGEDFATPKGTGWVLTFAGDGVIADRLRPDYPVR